MRILHICQHDDPETGGSIRVAEALVREQHASGIEAWMLFLYGSPGGLSETFAPRVACLNLRSSRQAFKGIGMLSRAIKDIAPDLIHSHDGILWPRLAYLGLSIPIVTHAHLPAGDPAQIKNLLGWPLIKSTSTHVIGISRHTSETWIDAGYPPKQITDIPNGVDFSRFEAVSAPQKQALREQLGLPQNKHVLLWLGRLHKEMKGTDRAERVAALLPDSHVLVIVGNGPDYEGMLQRGADAIASGKLIMAGSTSSPVEYYQAADAFLFTSYYEPFGLVILEAIACDLPILAFPVTNGGGAVELLKELNAVELKENFTEEELFLQLDRVDQQKKKATDVREMVKQKYAWSAVSRQTVEVYEDLTQRGVQ